MSLYTFRIIHHKPLIFGVAKWDIDRKEPVVWYEVDPKRLKCNCRSYQRKCSHIRRVLDLMHPDFINEIERWAWDSEKTEDDGWVELFDIPRPEELHG